MKRIALACSLLVACGPAEELDDLDGPAGDLSSPIINGTPDTTHHAVVAVAAANSMCSGTIIHVEPSNGVGHVLTAAHCGTPQYIIQANDYNSPSAVVYPVTASQNHPSYNQQVYDFKMVRFTGASAATPVIPAMTPAQDNLGAGTTVLHVGYGKAGPAPGSNNSVRRSIQGQLSGTTTTTISYNQPNGGPCSGDSGGPQLTVGGPELVAGVTSYGDQNCAQAGVSGRVSAVYNGFIVPFINNAPTGPLDCNGCIEAATTGMGACMPEVNACFSNASCSALVDCYQGCNTSSCIQQCNNSHPNGVPLYEAIIGCICSTGCGSECDGAPVCSQGGTSSVAASSSGVTVTNGAGGGNSEVGAGGATGAGAGTPGEGWSAGVTDEDFEGTIVTSGCSVSSGERVRSAGEPAPRFRPGAWLALLALGLVRRRARR
jgi:hypothetical protein